MHSFFFFFFFLCPSGIRSADLLSGKPERRPLCYAAPLCNAFIACYIKGCSQFRTKQLLTIYKGVHITNFTVLDRHLKARHVWTIQIPGLSGIQMVTVRYLNGIRCTKRIELTFSLSFLAVLS